MLVRIGEASKRVGVTPPTFRRYEDQGLIASIRTAGGERRYREEDIDRLAARIADGSLKRSAGVPDESQQEPEPEDWPEEELVAPDSVDLPSLPTVQPWERRVHEARADLEVTKVQQEAADLVRRTRDGEESREQQRQREQREQKRERARQEAERAEERRLAAIRSKGEFIATLTGAPPEFRAAVTRELGSYVNREQFPPSLDSWQVNEYLSALVEKVIKPWRDQQAAQRKAKEDRRRCDDLIWSGKMHARSQTSSWEWSDGERARREVERVLKEEVEPDWTRQDVIDLVDEVLEEWED